MSRKVFLSFLGNTRYSELEYYHRDFKYTSKFSPVATIKYLISNGFKPEVYYVFITDLAEKENLNLLKEELEQIKFYNLEPIKITNETNSNTLWINFEKVYSVLQVNDEVAIDITYGFRATPMLLITILNYAKVLKQISVNSIFYGAYEKDKIETPLWDLTDFSLIQDLAITSDEFLKYNIPDNFIKFFPDEDIKNEIIEFASIFSTNRSLEIYSGKLANSLKDKLNDVLAYKPKPFEELNNVLNERLTKYKENDILENGFNAIEFCIQSNLIQQAITILQELVITAIALYLQLDYKKEAIRNLISGILSVSKNKFDINKIPKKEDLTEEEKKNLPDKIYSLPYFNKLKKLYTKFTKSIRNDINHAGLRDNPRRGYEFKNKVSAYYKDFKKILVF